MPDVVQWRDFGLKKIVKEAQRVGLETLRVGIVGAKAHERSVDDRLTNAQVGIINHEGTDDGLIPPRRFLSEPFQNRRSITRFMRDAAVRIINGEAAESAMDFVGGRLAEVVREFIRNDEGEWKRNADATVEKKGFDHPLFWLGGLASAISHRVVRASGSLLEAGSSAGDYEHFEIESDGGE